MAVYYTMGVDCGADRSLADRISRHFAGFEVALRNLPAVPCTVSVTVGQGIHFVCVHPCGMGHATLPESERRPELLSHEATIRRQLYANPDDSCPSRQSAVSPCLAALKREPRSSEGKHPASGREPRFALPAKPLRRSDAALMNHPG